jgi:hypothetical protein
LRIFLHRQKIKMRTIATLKIISYSNLRCSLEKLWISFLTLFLISPEIFKWPCVISNLIIVKLIWLHQKSKILSKCTQFGKFLILSWLNSIIHYKAWTKDVMLFILLLFTVASYILVPTLVAISFFWTHISLDVLTKSD